MHKSPASEDAGDFSIRRGLDDSNICGRNSKIISPASPYKYKLNFKLDENLTTNKIYDII